MLTASNFDQQVQLENVVQEQFGKYDLTTVARTYGSIHYLPE